MQRWTSIIKMDQPVSKKNTVTFIYSVSRRDQYALDDTCRTAAGEVNCFLMNDALPLIANRWKPSFENNETRGQTKSDLCSGAGVSAASRLNMQLSSDRFEYNQHYISAGYKELIILPVSDGVNLNWEERSRHLATCGSFFIEIALPNMDGNSYLHIILPLWRWKSFANLKQKRRLKYSFRNRIPGCSPSMPTDDFIHNLFHLSYCKMRFLWPSIKIGLIGRCSRYRSFLRTRKSNCGFEDYEPSIPFPVRDAIVDSAIANFNRCAIRQERS